MRPEIALFRGFSTIWWSQFVHCVPVRISPVAVRVAVHEWSATRARDEGSGTHQGMTKVGVGLVSQKPPCLPKASLRSLSSAGTVIVRGLLLVRALLVDSESAWAAAEGISEALGPWSISLNGECKAMQETCVLQSQSLPEQRSIHQWRISIQYHKIRNPSPGADAPRSELCGFETAIYAVS